VMQEFIDVTTQHFVSHLLGDVGPNVILADTADIASCAPWCLLCQSQ